MLAHQKVVRCAFCVICRGHFCYNQFTSVTFLLFSIVFYLFSIPLPIYMYVTFLLVFQFHFFVLLCIFLSSILTDQWAQWAQCSSFYINLDAPPDDVDDEVADELADGLATLPDVDPLPAALLEGNSGAFNGRASMKYTKKKINVANRVEYNMILLRRMVAGSWCPCPCPPPWSACESCSCLPELSVDLVPSGRLFKTCPDICGFVVDTTHTCKISF